MSGTLLDKTALKNEVLAKAKNGYLACPLHQPLHHPTVPYITCRTEAAERNFFVRQAGPATALQGSKHGFGLRQIEHHSFGETLGRNTNDYRL